ncbi:unnamed protein product [Dibothriocephalus latus]|uniref:Uncharacterized protein n=1 Tax=Dibothriocephalus latus TaxID=60516 RepID=A0A3P7MYS3_DIBLA|nr:unnamed protein product [Dibothriocephalus latus]
MTGLNQFTRDIELMTTVRPNWYWRITWLAITPLTAIGLIIFKIITDTPITLNSYVYPEWAQACGVLIGVFPVVCIPAWFMFKYCREGGWIVLRELVKPAYTWGPALDEHRNEFLSRVHVRAQRKNQQVLDTNESKRSTSQLNVSGSNFNSRACLQTIPSSMNINATQTGEPDFFQSKLNIAEKMTNAHAKDLGKRGGPCTANPPEDLAAAPAGASEAANKVSSTK